MADSDDDSSLSDASSTVYRLNNDYEEVSSTEEDSVVEVVSTNSKRRNGEHQNLNDLLDEQSLLAEKIRTLVTNQEVTVDDSRTKRVRGNSLSQVFQGSSSTKRPRPSLQILPTTSAGPSDDFELPSIPDTLILRCQDLETTVHLADLLPQNRGLDQSIYFRHSSTEQQREEITSIAQWIRAFGVFAAYRTSSHPQYAVPMWSYVDIVTGMAERDDPWMLYDVNFRMFAAQYARTKVHDLSIWCRVHEKSLQDTKPRLPVASRLGYFTKSNKSANLKV